jgi:hypothetical protein
MRRWLFFPVLFLPVLVALWPDAAEAACRVDRWRFFFGSESNATMTTDGAPCRTQVRWTGAKSAVHAVAISSPPRNGRASASGNGVTYQPRAGFKGTDTFVFTITGEKSGAGTSATVRATVTVR